MTKMVAYCPVDAACDQMAVQFQRDSLPPVLAEGKVMVISYRHGWNNMGIFGGLKSG